MESIGRIIEGTLVEKIAAAVKAERERIARKLAENEDACHSHYMYCHYDTCEDCWRAYLEPPEEPGRSRGSTEGVGE